ARLDQRRLVLLTDDIHAELDAFVADEHGWTRNQLPDLVLALAAKGAVQRVFRVATAGLGHRHSIAGPAELADTEPLGTRQARVGSGAASPHPTRAMKLYVLQFDQQLVKSPAPSSACPLLDRGRPRLDHLVDQTKVLGFERRQEPVALDRRGNHLERLPGMLNVNFVKPRAQPQDYPGLDLDV